MTLTPEQADAIIFLQRLIAPCDGNADAHSWRRCRRCAALHQLENRDETAIRLVTIAIATLRHLD